MRAAPIPFIGGFYADETRPYSQQDIVNWLPAASESQGTRSLVMAKTPPGLSPFVRIAVDPVRGIYNAEGRLFTAMGNTLLQVSTTGASTIGTIPGVSRVKFAHNQITGGNELLAVNGSAGFIYNTVTAAFTPITDDGYPGAIDALFMDGYFVQIEPARRYAFNSDLADGLSYNTLDRFTSEKSPDLLVALGSTQNDLILFSEGTAEFFENTGAAQQPFRSKRISMERGCASRYGVVHLDNTVFWLGNDGKFYILDGYNPRRISTRPIEQAILGLNWAQAFGFVWESAGHSVAYWTFPDGQTWGYDVSQPPGFQWHRRESYGFDRWRITGTAFWRNRWIAGDFQRGDLWELDWDYPLEYDTEMVSELTGPVIHDHQNAVKMPRLELVFDTGQPEVAVRSFEIDPGPPVIVGDVPGGDVGDAISGTYTVSGGVLPYGPVTVLSGTFPPGLTLNPDGTYSGVAAMSGTYNWTVGGVDADGVPFSTPDTATYIGVSVWIAQQDLSENYARSASGTNWQEEANRTHAGFTTQHVSAWDGRIITGAAATASYAQSIDGALTFAAYPAMPEGTSSGGKTIKINGVYLSPRGQLPTNGVARTTDLGGSWSTVLVSGSGTNTMHAISARIGLAIVTTSGGRVSRSLDNGASWSALVQVFPPGVGIQGIANNGDRFVLVGDDHTMMYTDDGLTFHPITSPFARSGGTSAQNVIGAVACGNGVFVAGVDTAVGGTAGQLAYSLDGENFATTAVGLGGGCLCLAYADGLFVSAGRNSKIATSPDGPNWTQRANHFAGDIRSVTALIGSPLA